MLTLHSVAYELDLSVRICLFLIAHVSIYTWVRLVVAPCKIGTQRLLNSIAVVPILFVVSFLFRKDRIEEFIPLMYAATNFTWLTMTKIISFCLNRGQLMRSYEIRNEAAFALSLLFPVTVAFKEKQVETDEQTHSDGHAYRDVRFSLMRYTKTEGFLESLSIARRIIAKFALLLVMDIGSKTFEEWNWHFLKNACFGWVMYGSTSLIEDFVSLLVLIGLNMKLATNFDCPWLAQTITEFWSRRYNLVFGQTLRDFVYEPICKGRWIPEDRYFSKTSSSALRKMLGVMVTFAASGLFHVLVLWHAIGGYVPVMYGMFFVACGVVVITEGIIQMMLKKMGYYKGITAVIPQWAYHVYAFSMVFTLNHLLFWPDLHKMDVPDKIVNGMTYFMKA